MTRIASWILAGAAAMALTAPMVTASAVAQDAAASETLSLPDAEAREVVNRASAWLNTVTAMQGRFEQVNADGSLARGDFYIHRPGRLRFAYDPPSALTIVADGRTVAAVDSELNTVDRTLLDETPLSWLLRPGVDLSRDAQVRGVGRQDGLLMISLGDPRNRVSGQMILIFSDPEFTLREWVTVDEFGQQTRVILNDMQRVDRLDSALFTYEAPRSAGPRR